MVRLLMSTVIAAFALMSEARAQEASRFAAGELARLTFDQWVATLKGAGRPDPNGPVVLDWIEPGRSIGLTDKLRRGSVGSFHGWCDAHRGAGAYTPRLEASLESVLTNDLPATAYSQAAARRDRSMLVLSSQETRYKFDICTDGTMSDLGSYQYVMGKDCEWNGKDLAAPFPCRAIIYDRRALVPFDSTIRPAFAAITTRMAVEKAARATRLLRWRAALAPGDDATAGLVIARNGAVAQVQDPAGGTRWLKVSELEPR